MSLLGIDVGTTMCKAAAFTSQGRCIAMARREYHTLHPQPGWAELDAPQVWELIAQVIAEVAFAAKAAKDPVTALCAGSLGEAFVPVTRQREIAGSSIICSADVRGSEYVAQLSRKISQEDFYRINPNLFGPQYSWPKIAWLKDHRPQVFQKADLFLLWGDFVGFMLGADPFASNSLANRTLLFDWQKNDWSDHLLQLAGLDRQRLGKVVPGGTVVGTVSPVIADKLGLTPDVKIVAGAHDQCCNSLGSGCISHGTAVCGIGTFECITPAFAKPADPLRMLSEQLNIEHHLLPNLYVAFLFNQAGSLVKWFRDTFAVDAADSGDALYNRLTSEMPADPTGLIVLPHFESPVWPKYLADTSGVIIGLHTHTKRGEILKAIMESTTFYFVKGIAALKQQGIDLSQFIAAGGGAKSDAWLQMKADILGIPIVRPQVSEGGLVGAAMMAGLSTGVWPSSASAAAVCVKEDRRFEPHPARHQRYQDKLALYHRLEPAVAPLLSDLYHFKPAQ